MSRPGTSSEAKNFKFINTYEVVLVGDEGSGKTTLAMTFLKGKSDSIENNVRSNLCVLGDEVGEIEILGVGQGPYQLFQDHYIRLAKSCLCSFSLTDIKGFQNVGTLLESLIKKRDLQPLPILLVGTKADMVKERTVTESEASELAKSFSISYMECDATNPKRVYEVFQSLGMLMKDLRGQSPDFRLQRRRRKRCVLL